VHLDVFQRVLTGRQITVLVAGEAWMGGLAGHANGEIAGWAAYFSLFNQSVLADIDKR
jgi:hypothetical protein